MKILKLFLMTLFVPMVMLAHSLSVTSSYEDGELFIESFFGDGNPCKGCTFKIKNGQKEVFTNKLGDDGSFEQSVELKTPFDVHVNGGMGHWADLTIDGDEMEDKSESMNSSNATMNSIDETKIRQIIRSELNKQNTKIETMIAKNKSNLEKMLVGLGYILGIFGLWQLLAQRLQK